MSNASPSHRPVHHGNGVVSPSRPRVAPNADPSAGTRAQLVFLWTVVRRWSYLCLPAGILLAVLAAGLVLWQYQPSYQAMAWLRIENKRPVIISDVKAASDSTKFIDTQIQLIRSPLVVGQALKERDIANLDAIKRSASPLDWLTERLTVSCVGQSELFNVQFKGSDPQIAATIANRVVEAYIELHSRGDTSDSQRLVELLEQEKERREKDLERLQENVRVLTKQITGKDPVITPMEKHGQVILAPTAVDEERLATAEVERQMLEVKVKTYEESLAKRQVEVPAVEVDAAIDSRDDVKQLQKAIDAARARLEQTVQVSAKGAEDPHLQQIQDKIHQQEQTLEQLRKKLHAGVVSQLQTQELQKREAELGDLKQQIVNKRGLEDLFRQRIAERLKNRENLSGQALELEFTRSELTRAETVYQQICDRATSLRTEMRAPTRVSLLEKATRPVKPTGASPSLYAWILALMAFVAPFGVAMLWEKLTQHVVEIEQLDGVAGLQVIGEIAALPVRHHSANGSGEKFRHEEMVYTESIDSLRTTIVVSEEMKDVKVLAVASAVSSEGKTSLASQLAVSLARSSGEPTLLIDGDMRAPDLHKVFDVPNEKGLVDILEGTGTASDLIISNWHEHLHLLPAGRIKHSPYALLGNGHLTWVLEELKAVYRYIVIDAPPVLSASEALIIAKAADGAILCTMKDRTRTAQYKLAAERLQRAGVRVLGAVLAGVPARSYAYKYGGYYYYGNHARKGAASVSADATDNGHTADSESPVNQHV